MYEPPIRLVPRGQRARSPDSDSPAWESTDDVDIVIVQVFLLRVGNQLTHIGYKAEFDICRRTLHAKGEVVVGVCAGDVTRRRNSARGTLNLCHRGNFQPGIVECSVT